MKQQFSVSTTAPEYKILKVSRNKLEQGLIKWETSSSESHNFALIHQDIFLTTNRFTCFMTKSLTSSETLF